MPHYISGLIAEKSLIMPIASEHGLCDPIKLKVDQLSFLPIDDEDLDRIFPKGQEFLPNFQYLSNELLKALSKLSLSGKVAYIETEYFGSEGGQGAVLFSQGRIEYGPEADEYGPINEALSRMGVKQNDRNIDEFDVVGLGDERNNENWKMLSKSE